jgi:hypothetical protein
VFVLFEREPWLRDQIDQRLANFCHLFPGMTPLTIPLMEHWQWVQMALACDEHVERLKEQRARR